MRYSDYEEGVYGEVDSLPGCSQVAVSHAVYVDPALRKQGRGKIANRNRLRMFKENLGYDFVLCTVNSTNEAQLKILDANGWSRLSSFKSRKTGHLVHIYGKHL